MPGLGRLVNEPLSFDISDKSCRQAGRLPRIPHGSLRHPNWAALQTGWQAPLFLASDQGQVSPYDGISRKTVSSFLAGDQRPAG